MYSSIGRSGFSIRHVQIVDVDIPDVVSNYFVRWQSNRTIIGKEQELRWKYRYDNPYCKALFNSRKIEIKKGSEKLILDSTKL